MIAIISDYIVWFWLAVFVITIVIEFITVEFVSIWFALASIPSLILSIFLPENIALQIILFFISGFGLMLLTRPALIKYFKKNIVTTNVDSYVGKTAIVIKEITSISRGQVDFEHMIWTAVSSETIEVGKQVKILSIEGNKFIVTKID
ncbi:NfeD family protein [Acholeplasma granularum]|uniref:NfeD family protein n=1 Tax=Acholeplasma granularum TaxID=264635 RepID=UPI00047213EA|nr:NfeD family protein [Acholeplasma granularum]